MKKYKKDFEAFIEDMKITISQYDKYIKQPIQKKQNHEIHPEI